MPILELGPEQPFSLYDTLNCGQVFRWNLREGWWYGVVGDHVFKIRQDGQILTYKGADEKFVRDYFQLDLDLLKIVDSFDRDPFIHTAVERCEGLRLVRQPKWECTVSYICATNSNIPMIRKRIELLARALGKKIEFEGKTYYGFPKPDTIADCCSTTLTECKMGYRASYILDTSCKLAQMKNWEHGISVSLYEVARSSLMQLKGIGPKAADCILLFAFQKFEAFPVDVWIRRIMQEQYLNDTQDPGNYCRDDTIQKFAREHFGPYCGYAQEYLYGARLG
ncbi:MAG: DNA glycosylase [Methanoregulaceae archaeon]